MQIFFVEQMKKIKKLNYDKILIETYKFNWLK